MATALTTDRSAPLDATAGHVVVVIPTLNEAAVDRAMWCAAFRATS